jgi:hypothetical protein
VVSEAPRPDRVDRVVRVSELGKDFGMQFTTGREPQSQLARAMD